MTTAAKPYHVGPDPYNQQVGQGFVTFGPPPLPYNFTWSLDRDGFPQPSDITPAGKQEYAAAVTTARFGNVSDPVLYWYGQPPLPAGWTYSSSLDLQTRFSGDGIIFPATTQNVIAPAGAGGYPALQQMASGSPAALAQIANWNSGGQVTDSSYALAFAMLTNYFQQGQASRGRLTPALVQGALVQWAKDSQAGLDMQIAQATGYTIGAALVYEFAVTAAATSASTAPTASAGADITASTSLGTSTSLTDTAITEGMNGTVGAGITGTGTSLTANAVGAGMADAGIAGSYTVETAAGSSLVDGITSTLTQAAQKAAGTALLSQLKGTPAKPAQPAAAAQPATQADGSPLFLVLGLLAVFL